jgi:hypothetical protein
MGSRADTAHRARVGYRVGLTRITDFRAVPGLTPRHVGRSGTS